MMKKLFLTGKPIDLARENIAKNIDPCQPIICTKNIGTGKI
jgi:hypothetical protein